MYALVSDNLGRIRVINIWENTTELTLGGNSDGSADRKWSVGSVLLESQNSCVCIHDSGYASFFTFADRHTGERSKLIKIGEPAKSFSVKLLEEGKYVACYDGYVSVFTADGVISTFPTIEGASCASSCGSIAAYGRRKDRCVAYDVTEGKEIWKSSPPPNDYLKLPLRDDDYSLCFIDSNMFIVGQTDGKLLIYDIRCGARPVYRSFDLLPEFPLIRIAMLDEERIIIGDTTGLNRICRLSFSDTPVPAKVDEDITYLEADEPDAELSKREGKYFAGLTGDKSFIGLTGGITGFAKHKDLDLVAIISCDRTCHLFDASKYDRTGMKIAYTKTLPTDIALFDDEMPPEEDEWSKLEEENSSIWNDYKPCPQASTN